MPVTPGISGSSGFFGALRTLGLHQKSVATSIERLSTGKKINRAGDDPSGLQAAELLKFRQREIEKKIDAFAREESRLGAAEGGLSVIGDMLLDLSGLVVTGANRGGLAQPEIDAIGTEIDSLIDGMNHIAATTFFDGQQILAGYVPQLGDLKSRLLEDPEAAQSSVTDAVDRLASSRAAIGARVKQIDHERNALFAEQEGNAGVLGSIEDTDYAKESAELFRAQILEQATIQAIRIDREQAGRVLDLIAAVPTGNRPIGR